MTILYFKCLKCKIEFDFNVGKVSNFVDNKHHMENLPACPICGNTEEADIIFTDKSIPIFQKLYDRNTKKIAIREYRPGKLMNYADIFGGSKLLRLVFKNVDYKIGDFYCVTPLCDCKDIMLHAFEAHSNLDNPLWNIAYNYQLDEITEYENISEEDSQNIINKLNEFDKDVFSKRHIALKKELRYPLNKKFKNNELEECKRCYQKFIPFLIKASSAENDLFDYEDLLAKITKDFDDYVKNYFICLVKTCSLDELSDRIARYASSLDIYGF